MIQHTTLKPGDRVRAQGTFKGRRPVTGTVLSVTPSSHPAWSDSVRVKLDEGLTMMVMSKETDTLSFYAAVLTPLDACPFCDHEIPDAKLAELLKDAVAELNYAAPFGFASTDALADYLRERSLR